MVTHSDLRMIPRKHQTLRGVIFDVDGTLVDSNDAHARAWVDALKEFGHTVSFERIRSLIGMGGDKLLPAAAGVDANAPHGKDISSRRGELFHDRYLPMVRAFPCVRELCECMRQDDLELFIATSAKEDELRDLLAIAGIQDLLTDTASRKEAKRSKPDPDVIEAAIGQSGYDPSQLVMIGDTPYDIKASQKAHLQAIGFLSGGWDAKDLSGAVQIYAGTWEMHKNFTLFEQTFV
jgi:phosphoglycolate phosphatase-like HAD superfamily hydrolase